VSIKFYLSENYQRALSEIEDFVFESSDNTVSAVENFIDAHDKALEFVAQNPNTPAVHPQTGDQSWIFGDGRYRIFFQVVSQGKETIIYFTHIIDNRRANLDFYPGNSLPTYEIE
jgi:plasmid stabilization system protein ParE